MSEYSRITKEIKQSKMSETMYSDLRYLRLNHVWNAIKMEAVPKILHEEYYIVPFLEEARDYDLFSVYVKMYKDICAKMRKRDPKFCRVSQLQSTDAGHTLGRDCSSNNIFADCTSHTIFTICDTFVPRVAKNYVFDTAAEREVTKQAKAVFFCLRGTRKTSAHLDRLKRDQLNIARRSGEMIEGKTIYVVNEAVTVDSITLQVTIGEKRKRWDFGGPIPVAFKFVKFRIRKRLSLSVVRQTDVLPGSDDAEDVTWEKPSVSRKAIALKIWKTRQIEMDKMKEESEGIEAAKPT